MGNTLEFVLTGFLDVLCALYDKKQLSLTCGLFPSMQILLNNSDVPIMKKTHKINLYQSRIFVDLLRHLREDND